MFEHPTTKSGSADIGDQQSTYNQGSSPHDDISSSGSVTPNQKEVDVEALQEEKRAAVTEAKKRFHEKEEARAQVSTLRATLEKSVQKNPDMLLSLQQDDPIMADEIAQKLFGDTVDGLVRTAQSQQNNQPLPPSRDEIRQVIKEENTAQERAIERKKLEKLEVDFFLDNDIDPKSQQFKEIMSTYNRFKPQTFDDAQEILEMAYAKTKSGKSTVRNTDATYTPGGGSAPVVPKKVKGELTSNQKELGKMLGITPKYL